MLTPKKIIVILSVKNVFILLYLRHIKKTLEKHRVRINFSMLYREKLYDKNLLFLASSEKDHYV